MATWLLQANLNHARYAQDLFVHTMAERGIGLGVAAEPYNVPDHPCWVADRLGSMAIHWRAFDASPPASFVEAGNGFVAVEWGAIVVVGCYCPPSLSLAQFEDYLDGLEE
ncbi:uncharacterized protein LOC105424946 [Pogonomyrmex barbatus]|uniref:Uncharacterized protein LOC105424946 n=1 Tax=Pogonomyrmex barbatus TaxID=144034 RepID=A0A6I9W5G8_9HYME|nr:uncharacterized protein LOC105424946 [Pogonomyrmex barbatus]